jgi:hypothetical protein
MKANYCPMTIPVPHAASQHVFDSTCACRFSSRAIVDHGDARVSTITPPRLERAVQPAGLEVVDAWVRDRGSGIAAAAFVTVDSSAKHSFRLHQTIGLDLLEEYASAVRAQGRAGRLHFGVEDLGYRVCGKDQRRSSAFVKAVCETDSTVYLSI